MIGNNRSKFVEFIKSNLGDTLKQRFSPLIYFWGTNPQTALFGYLQGQTSVDEMPRSKFRRQYLYVSDVQYLTSNVDLSKHYEATTSTTSTTTTTTTTTVNQKNGRHKLVQLQINSDEECSPMIKQQTGYLLDHNIRLALLSQLPSAANYKHLGEVERKANTEHDLSSSSSSAGSSSADSGVFAGGHSSSSSSSSTSSLTDVVIDGSTNINNKKCSCKSRYFTEPNLQHLPELHSFSTPPVQLSGSAVAVGQAEHHLQEHLEFGQCALDWHKSSHQHYHSNKLVALISAGMTTGSDKKYVTDTVATLEQLGYEVCVFIRRGVGGLKLSSARFFSPAKWRDFEAAVLSVRQQRPGAHLVAVGFSFGSIELCRYLSMSGKQSLIDAALLISCPFDPEAGGRNMRKRALNRRIDAYLARNLGEQLYQALFQSATSAVDQQQQQEGNPQQAASNSTAVSNLNGSMVNLANLPKIKSLVDFEEKFNRLLQNYPNSEAYAADSRLQDHLRYIDTPTLCLSSEDDFMAPLKLLPLEQIKANEKLCMVLTKRGGHMAFIDGLLWPKRPYFAQRIILRYMEAVKHSLLAAKGGGDLCGGRAPLSGLKLSDQETRSQSMQKSSSDQHLIQMFNVNGK